MQGKTPITPPICLEQLLAILLAIFVLSFVGCARGSYRREADRDVHWLIREKSRSSQCDMQPFSIQVDPQSRMFDPFCPDHPPMPPDDPDSHRLMHCVDCKKGYPCWHVNGDSSLVENPCWKEYLPLDEDRNLRLTAENSVCIALVNSTNYQGEFETLYLSALDVTAERFAFDKQYFAGNGVTYTADGQLRTGSNNSFSELGLSTRGVRVEKMFTTGADLVVGLANSIVWEFSGPDTNATSTLLDFTLVQPLLRRAGRDRVMETLTLSERTLLANVRALERFRRGFYLRIMTGRANEPGPTRRGGFFGTSGLAGFTGVGAGGFGVVGGAGGFGTGGFGSTASEGAGAAQAGGFLGLLQTQQDIRNQEANIAGLRSSLLQLEEMLDESLQKIPERPDDVLRQRLQIAQARQALLNTQSRLLNTQNQYRATLDAFKIRLGLPPHLCVKVEDPMLDQFNLIDTEIVPRQNAIIDLQQRIGDTTETLLDTLEPKTAEDRDEDLVAWNATIKQMLRQLLDEIGEMNRIRDEVVKINVKRARQDITQLAAILPERREDLSRLAEQYGEQQSASECVPNLVDYQTALSADVHPAVFDVSRFDNLSEDLEAELTRLDTGFDRFRPQLETVHLQLRQLIDDGEELDVTALRERLKSDIIFAIPGLLSQLAADVLDLSLIQARARTESIRLVPLDIDPFQALNIAHSCRRDWKNAKAALVDVWRLIEFNADDLESRLDIVTSGDISTVGDNPLKFRAPTGRLRVGLEFDAPLTRLLERNNYRQSLIEYQQARRSYYRFVDRVSQSLRATIRTIELNKLNFEQQRLAVLGAIDQTVLNDELLTLSQQRGETSGVTAARDVVSALADLQDAQNNFLSVWVNYEVLRRSLDLDLGTMQLDCNGFWIDPGPIGGRYPLPHYAECIWPVRSPQSDPPDFPAHRNYETISYDANLKIPQRASAAVEFHSTTERARSYSRGLRLRR